MIYKIYVVKLAPYRNLLTAFNLFKQIYQYCFYFLVFMGIKLFLNTLALEILEQAK
jgi:hypothetical protein